MSYPTDDPLPDSLNAEQVGDLLERDPRTYPGLNATAVERNASEAPATLTIQTGIFGASVSGASSLNQRLQAAMELERSLTLSIDTQSRDHSGRMTSWAVNMQACTNVMLGRGQRHLHINLRWSEAEGNWVCLSGSTNPPPASRR